MLSIFAVPGQNIQMIKAPALTYSLIGRRGRVFALVSDAWMRAVLSLLYISGCGVIVLLREVASLREDGEACCIDAILLKLLGGRGLDPEAC